MAIWLASNRDLIETGNSYKWRNYTAADSLLAAHDWKEIFSKLDLFISFLDSSKLENLDVIPISKLQNPSGKSCNS